MVEVGYSVLRWRVLSSSESELLRGGTGLKWRSSSCDVSSMIMAGGLEHDPKKKRRGLELGFGMLFR